MRYTPPVGCVRGESLAVAFGRAALLTMTVVAALLLPVAAYVVGATLGTGR